MLCHTLQQRSIASDMSYRQRYMWLHRIVFSADGTLSDAQLGMCMPANLVSLYSSRTAYKDVGRVRPALRQHTALSIVSARNQETSRPCNLTLAAQSAHNTTWFLQELRRAQELTLGSGRRKAIRFLYAASSGRSLDLAPNGVFKTTIFSTLSGFCIAHSIAYCPRM